MATLTPKLYVCTTDSNLASSPQFLLLISLSLLFVFDYAICYTESITFCHGNLMRHSQLTQWVAQVATAQQRQQQQQCERGGCPSCSQHHIRGDTTSTQLVPRASQSWRINIKNYGYSSVVRWANIGAVRGWHYHALGYGFKSQGSHPCLLPFAASNPSCAFQWTGRKKKT